MCLSIRKRARFLSILFLLGAGAGPAEEIRICLGQSPREKATDEFKGKYRGSVYLQKYQGSWLTINQLDLEEYLYGVVGNELDKDWPAEALKAQAVCSRTLALVRKQEAREKKQPYDVNNTIFHQVYGRCEDEPVIKAVDETRREVLAYQGTLVPIYFHACCGGQTASPVDVWGGRAMPWLPGVPDTYCNRSPYTSWERVFKKHRWEQLLDVAGLRSVQVIEQDASGRVRQVQLNLDNKKKICLTGHQLRMRINERAGAVRFANQSIIPSTFFTLEDAGDAVVLTGSGYGHGVGLCQWGARRMAEAGKTYREILAYYFPLLQVTSSDGQ